MSTPRQVGRRATLRISEAGMPVLSLVCIDPPACRLPRGPLTDEARTGLSVGEAIARVLDRAGEDRPTRQTTGDLSPRLSHVRHERDQFGDGWTRIGDHGLFARRGPVHEIGHPRTHVARLGVLHEAGLACDVGAPPHNEASRERCGANIARRLDRVRHEHFSRSDPTDGA